MIYYILWGDENTASTRLRAIKPGSLLPDARVGTPEEYHAGDVLIIQKRPDYEALVKAKAQGAKVIYDIDDFYWDRPEYKRMVEKADLVTVDTEEKKKLLNLAKVHVIPDCLDWDGEARTEQPQNGIVGWTGYGNNAHYLELVRHTLPEKYTLRLVTSPDWHQYFPDFEGKVQCRPWSLDMVDYYLRECECSLYVLPDKELENAKGMHKLLKSWANRVPCYTSPTPDYMKAMEEAGVGKMYLVTDWSQFHNIGFDERCHAYALQFAPETIVEKWKTLIWS